MRLTPESASELLDGTLKCIPVCELHQISQPRIWEDAAGVYVFFQKLHSNSHPQFYI